MGLRRVWALAPIKMLTWDMPWTTPSKSSGISFFFAFLQCGGSSPHLSCHTRRDVDAVMLITAALLARGWYGGPAEKLMLGHCPSGTKTVWLF